MAFEAMNNTGVGDIDMLVILNDNDMSISEPVGALNKYLARLLSGRLYNYVRRGGAEVLSKLPPVKELAKRWEEHMKGMVLPGTLFEEFGFNYIGPIDGHDLDTLVKTLSNVKELSGPQLLHVITRKGHGYAQSGERADPVSRRRAFDPKVRYRRQTPGQTDVHAGLRRLAVRHGEARCAADRHHARDARRFGPGAILAGISRPRISMSASPNSTP